MKNRISNNSSNFNMCLRFYFFVFVSILCFICQKIVFFSFIIFSYATIHHAASKKIKSNHLPSTSQCSFFSGHPPWCPINVFRHFVPSALLGVIACSCWAWFWMRMMTIHFSFYIVIISLWYTTITALFFLTQCLWTLSQKILFLVFFQPTATVPFTCWTTGGATTTHVSTFVSFKSCTID